MARTGFDPSTTNDATATKTVGGLYTHRGKEYRYWQMDTTAADTSIGQVMGFVAGVIDEEPTVIIGSANVAAAGVAVGIVNPDNFGFFQVSGLAPVQVAANNPLSGVKTGAAGQAALVTAADLPETYLGVQVAPLSGSLALCLLRMN